MCYIRAQRIKIESRAHTEFPFIKIKIERVGKIEGTNFLRLYANHRFIVKTRGHRFILFFNILMIIIISFTLSGLKA